MDVVKPLLSHGAAYAAELAKCIAAGVLVSGTVLAVLMWKLPTAGLAGVAVLGCVAFVFLYGLAGHQRGLTRVLKSTANAHGDLLFDQTLGRFARQAETREPGAMVQMLSAPARLVEGFQRFASNDESAIPRPLRRLGGYYVTRLAGSLGAGAFPTGVVADGRLNHDALKTWTVQQLRDRFDPSWQLFGLMAISQCALAAALWWFTR